MNESRRNLYETAEDSLDTAATLLAELMENEGDPDQRVRLKELARITEQLRTRLRQLNAEGCGGQDRA